MYCHAFQNYHFVYKQNANIKATIKLSDFRVLKVFYPHVWVLWLAKQSVPSSPQRPSSLVPSLKYTTNCSWYVDTCHLNNNSLFNFNALRRFCRRTTRPSWPSGAPVMKVKVRRAWLSVSIRGIDSESLEWRSRHCFHLRNNYLCLQGIFLEFTHSLLSHGRTFFRLKSTFFGRR